MEVKLSNLDHSKVSAGTSLRTSVQQSKFYATPRNMQLSQKSRTVRVKQSFISSHQSEDLSLLSNNERDEYDKAIMKVEETVVKQMVKKR